MRSIITLSFFVCLASVIFLTLDNINITAVSAAFDVGVKVQVAMIPVFTTNVYSVAFSTGGKTHSSIYISINIYIVLEFLIPISDNLFLWISIYYIPLSREYLRSLP